MNIDSLLRIFESKELPARNDCGFPGRYDFEDTSRMHGWGVEGEGKCDYPEYCPLHQEGICPLLDK